MPKTHKVRKINVLAARTQRDILLKQGREVPLRVRQLANLDPDKLPRPSEAGPSNAHPGKTGPDDVYPVESSPEYVRADVPQTAWNAPGRGRDTD